MKRFLTCLISLCVLIGALCACTAGGGNAPAQKLNIVCTTFAQYDWTKQILGSHESEVNLTLLLDTGVDLHSYQGNADDIIQISGCDMLIYVGGESDAWIEDALKEGISEKKIVINLIDTLGDLLKPQEAHDASHTEEPDEHVWLSLKNAKILCDVIATQLGKLDAANAADYTANAQAYSQKLTQLDEQYQAVVAGARQKTLLFGDRFPFYYLAHDYNLDYYAAFIGCSAETEASFESITFLAKKVDELGLSSVLLIDGTSPKIAQTIVENTKDKNQQLRVINSMQSVTAADVANGATYLLIMQQNLAVLQEALN